MLTLKQIEALDRAKKLQADHDALWEERVMEQEAIDSYTTHEEEEEQYDAPQMYLKVTKMPSGRSFLNGIYPDTTSGSCVFGAVISWYKVPQEGMNMAILLDEAELNKIIHMLEGA